MSSLLCTLRTEAAIHSFYVLCELDALAKEKPGCGVSFSREFRAFADRLAKVLFDYCAVVCMGEARHANTMADQAIEQFRRVSADGHGRDRVYCQYDMVDPIGSADALLEVFNSSWRSDAYGGHKWAELVECYCRYGEISSVCFVDMIVNKQHNGGTIFGKPALMRPVDAYRLNEFLNTRREFGALAFQGLILAPHVWDALKRAHKAGLIKSLPIDFIVVDDLGWPDPLEWGFVKLEAGDNDLHRETCPHCGEYVEDCECETCPDCGELVEECTCEKCVHCGETESYCGCGNFETEYDVQQKKEKEGDLHGIYEAYCFTASNMQLSRPV